MKAWYSIMQQIKADFDGSSDVVLANIKIHPIPMVSVGNEL